MTAKRKSAKQDKLDQVPMPFMTGKGAGRGGKRAGAGRKPSGKSSVIRVPAELVPDVEALISAYRIRWHIPNADLVAALNEPDSSHEVMTLEQFAGLCNEGD